jgi:hypothetical protein
MYVFTSGSLSVIMYSFGVSGDTECSRASAGRWKSRRQRGPWIRWSRGRMRRGRLGGEAEVEELDSADDVEEDMER